MASQYVPPWADIYMITNGLDLISGSINDKHCCCIGIYQRTIDRRGADHTEQTHWLAKLLRVYFLSFRRLARLIHFQWIDFALWGTGALGVYLGYKPPKRHTRLDHLSFWQKLGYLDLPGCCLLTAGLVLLLVGLNLGGNLYPWTNAKVLITMILGIFILIAFGLWEWKGTKVGIMNHELFIGENKRGRSFSIYVSLIFIEAILLFTFAIFYPVMYVFRAPTCTTF